MSSVAAKTNGTRVRAMQTEGIPIRLSGNAGVTYRYGWVGKDPLVKKIGGMWF